ncbi:MAG: aldo/keto reductase [Gammaproteobacteria bacterium]|nr:aldo/keto reductase [Gammaproteobacteria bacterium]
MTPGFPPSASEPSKSSEAARDRVAEALDLGYRHVDTARVDRTRSGVGEGVRKSSVPRDEVFVTSKVWQDDFRPEDLAKSVRASLKKTGLDYLDLMLLHWPNPDVPIAEYLGDQDALAARTIRHDQRSSPGHCSRKPWQRARRRW